MYTIEVSKIYQAMLSLRGVTQTSIQINEDDEVSYNAHMFYKSNVGMCKNTVQKRMLIDVGYEAAHLVVKGYPKGFVNGKDIGLGVHKTKQQLVEEANVLVKNKLRFLSFGDN